MHHILIPGFACVVMAPFAGEPDYLQAAIDQGYPIIYIIANNGDKFVRRTQPGKNADGKDRSVTMKIPSIPGFKVGEVKEDNSFLPAGKIPFSMMKEVEKFFKAVIAKFGDTNLESMIWIMWNPDQGYFLHVPNQTVAGAAVTYDWTPPAGSHIVVDIHSHANFGAFFSGTDDRDDSQTVRYSGVFGHNRNPNPMKIFRFNFMDVKKPATLEEIFEAPAVEVADTPAEWLDKVRVTTYTAGKGSSSYPGQSRHSVHGHGGNPNGYASSSYWDGPDPERYKAIKPSNTTTTGFKSGSRGWFLKGGGFVSFDDWEKEYPIALAQQKAEQAEKEAEKERKAAEKAARKAGATTDGGQQGTSPLGLAVRETEQSLDSQKDQVENKPDAKSNSLQNWNGNNSSSLVTRFPSTTFPSSPQPSNSPDFNPSCPAPQTMSVMDRDFQVGPGSRERSGQTQVTQSSQTTSSSAGPSTLQSDKESPTPEPDPAVNKASDTSQTSDSTLTNTTSFGGLADPLGIFTELVNRPVGYVSEPQEDGSYVLKTVVMDFRTGVTAAQEEALTELEQTTYQQELRDSQKGLLNGSTAALLEDTGKAPEGILQVEIPTTPTLVKKAVIGTSEVSPLGAGFSPTQVSAPVLQQRQIVPAVQQQAPSLIRKPPAVLGSTSDHLRGNGETGGGARNGWTRDQWLARNSSQQADPGYVAGESVDSWLDRRALQIQRDLGLMGAPTTTPIQESSIDRMHERQRQEDLLHDSEELATLQEGASILLHRTTASGVVNVLPENTIVLRLEEGDLPASFNADCVDYGTQAAGAKAIIDVAVQGISSNGRLLRKTVQGLFEQVNEDERLPLFRTLAHSLTSQARDDLGVNGL